MADLSHIARNVDGAPIGAYRVRLRAGVPPERIGGVLFDALGVALLDGLTTIRMICAFGDELEVEPADIDAVLAEASPEWVEAQLRARCPWTVRERCRVPSLASVWAKIEAEEAEAAARVREAEEAARPAPVRAPLGVAPDPLAHFFPPGTDPEHVDRALAHRAKVLGASRAQVMAEAARLGVVETSARAMTKPDLVDLVLSLHGWPHQWDPAWVPPSVEAAPKKSKGRFPGQPDQAPPERSLADAIAEGAVHGGPPRVGGQ